VKEEVKEDVKEEVKEEEAKDEQPNVYVKKYEERKSNYRYCSIQ
jgi:hypothetical protein